MATSDFGKAFRAARAAGDKTFSWKGKSYTTEMKESPKTGTTSRMSKAVIEQAQSSDDPIGVIGRAASGVLNDREAEATQSRGRKLNVYPNPDDKTYVGNAGRDKQGGRKASDEDTYVAPESKDDGAGSGTDTFKKGGSVRGWGQARGARAAKIV